MCIIQCYFYTLAQTHTTHSFKTIVIMQTQIKSHVMLPIQSNWDQLRTIDQSQFETTTHTHTFDYISKCWLNICIFQYVWPYFYAKVVAVIAKYFCCPGDKLQVYRFFLFAEKGSQFPEKYSTLLRNSISHSQTHTKKINTISQKTNKNKTNQRPTINCSAISVPSWKWP